MTLPLVMSMACYVGLPDTADDSAPGASGLDGMGTGPFDDAGPDGPNGGGEQGGHAGRHGTNDPLASDDGAESTNEPLLGQGETPLHRLTARQYINTVQAAWPELQSPIGVADLPPDDKVAGFSGASEVLNDISLENYISSAGRVSAWLVANPEVLWGDCDSSSLGQAECLTRGLQAALPVLYRTSEVDGVATALVREVFEAQVEEHGWELAAEMTVERALLSPRFLFKLEPGEAAPTVEHNAFALGDDAIASRLSYFIWDGPPDPELRDLAESGSLGDPQVRREQVARMLADERSSKVLARFYREWLHLEAIADVNKSADTYPEWGPALIADMERESELFFDHVVRQPGADWRDIFVAQYSFVNAPLAEVYGVASPSESFERVDLGPDRAGVLTQAAFLATHSRSDDTQMIHRGLAVREQILCQKLAPPENVDTALGVDRLTSPQCSGCHILIESIGDGFEQYDSLGRWRDVDSLGRVVGVAGGEFEFSSVAELGDFLADSPDVASCFAKQWFRFALGREESSTELDVDRAALTRAEAVLSEQGISAALQEIVASDAFTYRFSQPATCEAT